MKDPRNDTTFLIIMVAICAVVLILLWGIGNVQMIEREKAAAFERGYAMGVQAGFGDGFLKGRFYSNWSECTPLFSSYYFSGEGHRWLCNNDDQSLMRIVDKSYNTLREYHWSKTSSFFTEPVCPLGTICGGGGS